MKPAIKKLKDIRGRIKGYAAIFAAAYRGEGSTPAEAVTACETVVRGALARLERGTFIGKWRDHIYVVSPDTEGWRYWADVLSRTDYTVAMSGTREEAQDSALSHIAKTIWHIHVNDTVFVAPVERAVPAAIHHPHHP